MEINSTYPVTYNTPNIEYKKTTVTVRRNEQETLVQTYDRHGRLVETTIRSHNITDV